MKLRNLFLASVAIAGLFTACSNEMDEATDNGAQAKEEAYVSFAIQMPGSAATRATATENGSTEESKVSEVTLLFFDSNAPHNLTDIQTISTLTKASDYVYNTEAFLISKGTKLVYAFANAQPAIKAFATNDNGAAYKTITEGIATDQASDLAVDNKFTMSNAKEASPVTVTHATSAAAKAAPISIEIERTVAKIQYTGSAFKFDIKRIGNGEKMGEVTLTDMTLINANKKYYYLRRTSTNPTGTPSTIGGTEIDGTTYVVDPNFTQNVSEIDDTYRTENFFDMSSTAITKDKVFYCHENTMAKDGQYVGATTGVTFKAKFTFDGYNGTFYRFNGQLYKGDDTSLEALRKDANIAEAVNVIKNWNIDQWKAKNVDLYQDGICYYHYMIKHMDNSDPTAMGIMEFGVVRNNVYKLNVTSIEAIGANISKPEPTDPDETEKVYIAVSMTVKPWTIRSNENIGL